MSTLKTTAIAPWYGSSRMIGPHVGKALRGRKWVALPFCGGLCEVAHIEARSIVASDLHREIINLCHVLKQPTLREQLVLNLSLSPFHPDQLQAAQEYCLAAREAGATTSAEKPNEQWAEAYFVSQWMGRSGKAGCRDEFAGKLSTRFNANGGDSNTRYRSSVASIEAWARIMERCNFHCLDAFDFLAKCLTDADLPENGIYCDPPWPDDGERYLHKFTGAQQGQLSSVALGFRQALVVMRFGDHPLIRQLYPEALWNWQFIDGRTSGNNAKAEVLLTRKRSGQKGMFA